jgi:iron complex transport system substrate-binding protein
VFRVFCALALLGSAACARREPRTGSLVDDAGAPVVFTAPPRRVVSLIPATTELLFALGAGSRLVGRTTWCDYPREAAAVPDLGNGIGPNIEKVLDARPDLVLLYRSSANAAAAARLRELGIAVLELRTDRIEDLDRIARLLGRVLGIEGAADSLVAWISADIAAASQTAGQPGGQGVRSPDRPARSAGPARPSVFLLAWNRPPITLGGSSFLSEILELAGARNLFHDLSTASAPISIEAVAQRNPDFVLTQSGEVPAIAGLPEWQVVPAVRGGRFLRVQGSEFNRPTPRIGTAIRKLRAALDSARR